MVHWFYSRPECGNHLLLVSVRSGAVHVWGERDKRPWSDPTAGRAAHFGLNHLLSTRKSGTLSAGFSSSVITSRSFVGIFLHVSSEEQLRKCIPRHLWPISDVNVLTWLVLLHFGSLLRLISWPEQTVRFKKEKQLKNASTYHFFAFGPNQIKQTPDVKVPWGAVIDGQESVEGPETDAFVWSTDTQTHPFKMLFFIRQMSRFFLHFYTTANSNTTNVPHSSRATTKIGLFGYVGGALKTLQFQIFTSCPLNFWNVFKHVSISIISFCAPPAVYCSTASLSSQSWLLLTKNRDSSGGIWTYETTPWNTLALECWFSGHFGITSMNRSGNHSPRPLTDLHVYLGIFKTYFFGIPLLKTIHIDTDGFWWMILHHMQVHCRLSADFRCRLKQEMPV